MALAKLLVESGPRHVTAEELFHEARTAGIPVSLATVYNTLHQFTSVGLLREVVVDMGQSYFDTNTSHHHHFFDETTRALTDDLPLFAVPSRAAVEPQPPTEAEQLIAALAALHPDEMSPREALDALYALKAKLPKD